MQNTSIRLFKLFKTNNNEVELTEGNNTIALLIRATSLKQAIWIAYHDQYSLGEHSAGITQIKDLSLPIEKQIIFCR